MSPTSKPRSDPSVDTSQSPSPSPSPSPLAPSRKSDRKRKAREFPDSASSFKILPGSVGGAHQIWTDAEEVALLKAAVRFRARTGSPPRTPDMEEFFESVKRSLGSGMDQVRVFYKLKRLKSRFLLTSGPLKGPHERLLYKLSAEVWGSEAMGKNGREVEEIPSCEERGEMENGSVNCAFVTAALREYWRETEKGGSGALLEEGLRCMNPARAGKLEMKWREQVESDMRLKSKRHEIVKEVYDLLVHAVRVGASRSSRLR